MGEGGQAGGTYNSVGERVSDGRGEAQAASGSAAYVGGAEQSGETRPKFFARFCLAEVGREPPYSASPNFGTFSSVG